MNNKKLFNRLCELVNQECSSNHIIDIVYRSNDSIIVYTKQFYSYEVSAFVKVLNSFHASFVFESLDVNDINMVAIFICPF